MTDEEELAATTMVGKFLAQAWQRIKVADEKKAADEKKV